MKLSFRSAEVQDLPALNRISVQSKRHWGYPDEWIEAWMEDLTITYSQLDEQHILIALVDQQSIGFCSLIERASYYEIMHLWVLPEHIGHGYGKALLTEAITRYAADNLPIHVVADPNAEKFYHRMGFKVFDHAASFPKGRLLPVMRRAAQNAEDHGINHHYHSFYLMIWCGALCRYLLGGKREPFDDYYRHKDSSLNFLRGFGVLVLLVLTIISLALWFRIRFST